MTWLAPFEGVLNVWMAQADHIAEATPYKVGQIYRPLLIAHGDNECAAGSDVAAMRQRGLPVTCVVYPDEGMAFSNPKAVPHTMPSPFATHLGGRLRVFREKSRRFEVGGPREHQGDRRIAEYLDRPC